MKKNTNGFGFPRLPKKKDRKEGNRSEFFKREQSTEMIKWFFIPENVGEIFQAVKRLKCFL